MVKELIEYYKDTEKSVEDIYTNKAQVLLEALPYIKEYFNRIVIVKLGGAIMDNDVSLMKVLDDLMLMKYVGINVIVIHGGGKQITRLMEEKKIKVDVVCLSVGLTPLTELAWMAKCEFIFIPALGGNIPMHNWNMESSKKDLYIAGDLTGIEEASTALEEGRLAGLAVAESLGYLKSKEASKRKAEVRERLIALRGGPFGELRRKLKEPFMQGDEIKK